MRNEKEVRKDTLKVSIKFWGTHERVTSFTVYGKNIGMYSYNAIMDGGDQEALQFISIPDDGIHTIKLKATERNKECAVLIINPHNLVGFILNDPLVELQFNGIHYCYALKYFSIKSAKAPSMSLNDFRDCDHLRRLELDCTRCTGDIYSLSGLHNLMWVSIDYTRCEGDISVLSSLTKLWRFSSQLCTGVRGNINKMHCPEINSLKINGTECAGDPRKFINNNGNLEELKAEGFYYHYKWCTL